MENQKKIYDIKKRAYWFGIKIIKLARKLPKDTAAFVIARQLIRSATSIGANIAEGRAAVSKKDFINFYAHALKSATETKFWLSTLIDADLLPEKTVVPYLQECEELSKIIASSILKAKESLKRKN